MTPAELDISTITHNDKDARSAFLEIVKNRSVLAILKAALDKGDPPNAIETVVLDPRMGPCVKVIKDLPPFRRGEECKHRVLLTWQASAVELDAIVKKYDQADPQFQHIAVSMFSRGQRTASHLFNEAEINTLLHAFEHEEIYAKLLMADSMGMLLSTGKLLGQSMFGDAKEEAPAPAPVEGEAAENLQRVMGSIGMGEDAVSGFIKGINNHTKKRKEASDDESCMCSLFLVKTPKGQLAVAAGCQMTPFAAFAQLAKRELDCAEPTGIIVERIEYDAADKYVQAGAEFFAIKDL